MLFHLKHISLSSHFARLSVVYFRELGRTDTSPNLEGMVLCMAISCVDCMCLVTLAGWLKLWLVVLGNSVLGYPGGMA